MRMRIALVTAATVQRKQSRRRTRAVTYLSGLLAAGPGNPTAMPLARDRLEVLQVRKLVQCVRVGDKVQIAKLVEHGISGLVNYQGDSLFTDGVTINYTIPIVTYMYDDVYTLQIQTQEKVHFTLQ